MHLLKLSPEAFSRGGLFKEGIKEGEADHKGDSNVEDGQDSCKDDASDKSQTSDLGIGLSCLLEAYKRKLMFLSLINLFN